MVDDQGNGEYGRPRRPNPETVSYLSGLPLDENLAAQQAREYIEYFRKRGRGDHDAEEGDGGSEPPEYPQMLGAAHAALSSVFREVASLACEEIPSRQIETLVRIACRFSLAAKRVVLASMSGYWVFLSTHRFGSHVAQTVLRCVVAECEEDLDRFDDGQGEQCEGKMIIEDSYGDLLQNDDGSGGTVSRSLPGMILETFEELKPFASELTVHVCGTHVIRSTLCILCGVEFVDAFPHPGTNEQNMGEWERGVLAATRRGKLKDKKKKKKKRGNHTHEEGGNTPHVMTVMKEMKLVHDLKSVSFKKDADALLIEMVGLLSMMGANGGGGVCPPGELQQLTCHPSAGPLLVQMIRLLSYRDGHTQLASKKKDSAEILPNRRLCILPPEPKYAHGGHAESLVHRLLCWDSDIEIDGDGSAPKQPYASDILYGLSGEPRGSILLETMFHCCPDSFHNDLCTVGGFYDEKALREYIEHGVSNFVVQVLLTTVRSREQMSKMVKCLCGIIEDGSILKGKPSQSNDSKTNAGEVAGTRHRNCRMGIVWRAVEMCARGSSQDQEQILSALLRGFASTTTSSEDAGTESNIGAEKKHKRRSKAKGLPVEECIPLLLGLSPGSCEGEGEFSSDGSRLTLDPAGARALYHILQFKERLRTDWVRSIVRIYCQEDLVKLANDGLGSRCVIDGLLDGPARSLASKLLVEKLSDRITYLATERVGHHTVEKLFRALPKMEDKAAISAELSRSLNRLGSNSMGRSVMTSCAVKDYLEGESAFLTALAKQRDKD
ncbi:hypothetical protein ACHAWF_003758, partial [Thalassiosira exigua]